MNKIKYCLALTKFLLIFCLPFFVFTEKVFATVTTIYAPSPIVRVHSKLNGFGILTKVDGQVAVLTNSHLLKGQKSAKILMTFSIPYLWSKSKEDIGYVPKFYKLELNANVLEGSDDPVGDIVLLYLEKSISEPFLKRISFVSNEYVNFCKISSSCPEGYKVKQTLEREGILTLHTVPNYYATNGNKSESLDVPYRIPSVKSNTEAIKQSDNLIASENLNLLLYQTYGKEGLSGSPYFTRVRLGGILTEVHLDGTPIVYAIPLADIARRIQFFVFKNNSIFTPKVFGAWRDNGNLNIKAGNYQIIEANPGSISKAGGELGNSGGEPGNSGGEPGNSGGEPGNSGELYSSENLDFPNNINKITNNVTIVNGRKLLLREYDRDMTNQHEIEIPLEFRNPLIPRSYNPIRICGFQIIPCTLDETEFIPVPYLISPKQEPILATTAALSKLAIEDKLSFESEPEKYQIPSEKIAGSFLEKTRLSWNVDPKYIRHYNKDSESSWSLLTSSFSFDRVLFDFSRNNEEHLLGWSAFLKYNKLERTKKYFFENDYSAFEIKFPNGFKSFFSDYTNTEPYGFMGSSDKNMFAFRFIEYRSKSFIEIKFKKSGQVINISEKDIYNPGNEIKKTKLNRISLNQQASWWFSESPQNGQRSQYNAVYVFDKDNLSNLERIFIETPKVVFEIIYCHIGEINCIR